MSEEVAALLAEVEELRGEVKDLRGERNKWKAEKAELEEVLAPALEAQRRELVRGKGFEPDSTEGRQIMKAMARGEIEADGSNLVEVAESEFGYAPALQRGSMSDLEFAYSVLAERMQAIDGVTVSTPNPSTAEEIAEAEASGNWERSRMLKSSVLAKGMSE